MVKNYPLLLYIQEQLKMKKLKMLKKQLKAIKLKIRILIT